MKDFTVSASFAESKSLLPLLMEDFGVSTGYSTLSDGATNVSLVDDADEPVAEISMVSSQATEGLAGLADGSSILAILSRVATDDEIHAVSAAVFGDISTDAHQSVLAMDGLVILVSDRNSVNILSIRQIGEIFSGKIKNWSAVGGSDAAINVYRQNVSASDTELFRQLVLGPISGGFTPSAAIVSNNTDISATVNVDPMGVAFASFANSGEAKAVTLIDSCGIRSVPNTFNINSEGYPLAHRIRVYSTSRNLPEVAIEMVAYLDSDAAQVPVLLSGYVSLDVETLPATEQGLRFANAILASGDGVGINGLRQMTTELVSAVRLSTTFRFNDGGSTLDVRAERDIQRLVDWLAGEDLSSKEILLVGFTDSIGKISVNKALLEQRARQIRDAILLTAPSGMLDDVDVKVIGLGEVSPLVCNKASRARFVNRRVEVWMRDKS